MQRTTIIADKETMLELQSIARREKRSAASVIREALATFVHNYQARLSQRQNPLLALAALGQNRDGETDISERAEEILATEINPVSGWSIGNGNDS